MTAEEAVETLQKVERLLSRKLEGVSPGPWIYVDRRADLSAGHFVENEHIMIIPASGEGITRKGDAHFIALSSVAVPALLGSVRAVLKEWKNYSFGRDKTFDGEMTEKEIQSSILMFIHSESVAEPFLIDMATELEVLLKGESDD